MLILNKLFSWNLALNFDLCISQGRFLELILSLKRSTYTLVNMVLIEFQVECDAVHHIYNPV